MTLNFEFLFLENSRWTVAGHVTKKWTKVFLLSRSWFPWSLIAGLHAYAIRRCYLHNIFGRWTTYYFFGPDMEVQQRMNDFKLNLEPITLLILRLFSCLCTKRALIETYVKCLEAACFALSQVFCLLICWGIQYKLMNLAATMQSDLTVQHFVWRCFLSLNLLAWCFEHSWFETVCFFRIFPFDSELMV